MSTTTSMSMTKAERTVAYEGAIKTVATFLRSKRTSLKVNMDLTGTHPVPTDKAHTYSRAKVRAWVNRVLTAGTAEGSEGRSVFRDMFAKGKPSSFGDRAIADHFVTTKNSRVKGQYALVGLFDQWRKTEMRAAAQARTDAIQSQGNAWFVTAEVSVEGARFDVASLVDKDDKQWRSHLDRVNAGTAYPSRRKALGAAARAVFGPQWADNREANVAAVAHMVGQGGSASGAVGLDADALDRLRSKATAVAPAEVTVSLTAAQVKTVAKAMGAGKDDVKTGKTALAYLVGKGLTAEAIESMARAL